MKLIGKNDNNIIVELDGNDLKNYQVEYDYWKKPQSIELKAKLLQDAKTEIIAAKKEIESFVKCNKYAFKKIVKAGTLVGMLFQDKPNSIRKIEDIK